MMMKQMMVVAVAAFGLMGTAFADGADDVSGAKETAQQVESRKAWQQGFEKGYQRGMDFSENRQARQRKRFVEQRQARFGQKAEGKGPKGPEADGVCPRGEATCDKPKGRGPHAEGRGPKGPRGEGMKGRRGPHGEGRHGRKGPQAEGKGPKGPEADGVCPRGEATCDKPKGKGPHAEGRGPKGPRGEGMQGRRGPHGEDRHGREGDRE